MTLDSDFRLGDWIVKPHTNGHKWTAVLEPRFHLELARLERQEGQHAQAMRHYRDFLALWSDADRDLPEIAEARTYLASIS